MMSSTIVERLDLGAVHALDVLDFARVFGVLEEGFDKARNVMVNVQEVSVEEVDLMLNTK